MKMAELRKIKEDRKANRKRMIRELEYDALRMDLDAYIAKNYVPKNIEKKGDR